MHLPDRDGQGRLLIDAENAAGRRCVVSSDVVSQQSFQIGRASENEPSDLSDFVGGLRWRVNKTAVGESRETRAPSLPKRGYFAGLIFGILSYKGVELSHEHKE